MSEHKKKEDRKSRGLLAAAVFTHLGGVGATANSILALCEGDDEEFYRGSRVQVMQLLDVIQVAVKRARDEMNQYGPKLASSSKGKT